MTTKYCPICGEENKCMSGGGKHGNCWCDAVTFPPEIFELVPLEYRRKDCICQKCLTSFIEKGEIRKV
ncbi:cysteine-rich CWC family protein [Neobacillus mesonae]|uniref:cysteine-rich CWC family protein n=1 Tax=Neobacillus mesonae TaxID=1193713 RepID=UPI00203BF12F|nr:cysteine-rich CWC family protein [Neobacillus mesonae]MCM3567309.1 cysteine-rich CWC family protein [Neobacillus mesonae]